MPTNWILRFSVTGPPGGVTSTTFTTADVRVAAVRRRDLDLVEDDGGQGLPGDPLDLDAVGPAGLFGPVPGVAENDVDHPGGLADPLALQPGPHGRDRDQGDQQEDRDDHQELDERHAATRGGWRVVGDG